MPSGTSARDLQFQNQYSVRDVFRQSCSTSSCIIQLLFKEQPAKTLANIPNVSNVIVDQTSKNI